MRRFHLISSSVLPVVLLACTACSRSETQGTTSPNESALSTSNATESSATSARPDPSYVAMRPACLVPTPDVAPQVAKPAPAADCPADPDHAPELGHVFITFADAPSSPRVSVEQAVTDAERERGLMYRTHLGEDDGMIFSWPAEQIRSFWMHNTCIPLDMLFITRDGTIVGILEQVPVLNNSPRGVPCPAAYVLEMNAGWTRKHGVVAGQHVQIEP